jgi:hypothetical protein
MSNATRILIFLLLLVFSACKTTQPARPAEYYENLNTEAPVSTINIPVRIHKNELLQSINRQIGETLFDDNNIADDGLMVRAKKKGSISIDVFDQEIRYRVPVDLWIKKDIVISDVEGEGTLALNFSTRYNIKNDWSLETTTQISGYEWLRKPIIKLGFANLEITPIANAFLNHVKGDLAKEIDAEVKNVLDLRREVEAAWTELQQPVLLSDEYASWLMLNPQTIGMTPMKADGNMIQSTIVVETRPFVNLGEKPKPDKAGKLPGFSYRSTENEDFTLFLDADIPFKEAERLSRQSMIGEQFSYGKKNVTVEDIELYGQGNRLVVNTKLKGSYNGNVYFLARPEYNARKNKIDLEDVDFDFSSQKALMKSASWLFKGPMKKKVQESLNFYLNYNLEDTKAMIQKEMQNYQLAPGISMTGLLQELNVSHVYIASEAIRVRIGLKGNLKLDVKSLGQ